MRSGKLLPTALWGAAIVLAFAAFRVTARPMRDTPIEPAESISSPGAARLPDHELLAERATELRSRNPFRLERTPTSRAFSLADPADAAPAPIDEVEAPAPPVLSIGGIVGGPPWSAVVEGVPGQQTGVLIRVGEESNGVRVEWVRNDSVAVSMQDTAWILALKRLWHR